MSASTASVGRWWGIAEFDPVISMHGSDSQSLDNMLELMVAGGMELIQALRILVPPATQSLEFKDADEATRRIALCNSGVMAVEAALLARLHGVPVVTFVLPGDRTDHAHRLVLTEVDVSGRAGTRMDLTTDLEVRGLPTRLGERLAQAVSGPLVQQFLTCMGH